MPPESNVIKDEGKSKPDGKIEDGSINSGNPDINQDAPLEERIFTDDEIARNSKYSVVHQLYKSDPLVAGTKR